MAVQELVTLLPRLEKFDSDLEFKFKTYSGIKQTLLEKIFRNLEKFDKNPITDELWDAVTEFAVIDKMLTERIASCGLLCLDEFIFATKKLLTPQNV